jgi:hypothetical protein
MRFSSAIVGGQHERPTTLIALFIDADNLSKSEWFDEACRKLTLKLGRISVRRAYGSAETLKGLSKELHDHAIRPFVNLAVTKNTTDLALAVDCMELACQTPTLTTLAIGSGDADFFPLVVRLRERGIRMVCVSRKDNLADDAALFYDEVVLVGADAVKQARSQPVATSAAATASAKAPQIKGSVTPPKAVKAPAPGSPPAVKGTKSAALPKKDGVSAGEVTVEQILKAAPQLKAGQLCTLTQIAVLLRAAKLLGPNASSVKFFKSHQSDFTLAPQERPDKVRYVGAEKRVL